MLEELGWDAGPAAHPAGPGEPARVSRVAADVDLVLVVVSPADPPDPARLDRLLAVAGDSGARPVVVLTKADLAAATADAGRDEVAGAPVAGHAALRQEVDWLRDRYDARRRAEQRRQWRQLSRAVRAGRAASPRRGR